MSECTGKYHNKKQIVQIYQNHVFQALIAGDLLVVSFEYPGMLTELQIDRTMRSSQPAHSGRVNRQDRSVDQYMHAHALPRVSRPSPPTCVALMFRCTTINTSTRYN